jgi:hypothetical protein
MTNGGDGDSFDAAWRRITVHAGERFATKTGLPFTYEVHGDTLIPDRTHYPLHASNFRTAKNNDDTSVPARQAPSATWQRMIGSAA